MPFQIYAANNVGLLAYQVLSAMVTELWQRFRGTLSPGEGKQATEPLARKGRVRQHSSLAHFSQCSPPLPIGLKSQGR